MVPTIEANQSIYQSFRQSITLSINKLRTRMPLTILNLKGYFCDTSFFKLAFGISKILDILFIDVFFVLVILGLVNRNRILSFRYSVPSS